MAAPSGRVGNTAMPELKPVRDMTVVGPAGMPLRLADLPAGGTTRWVARRKAEVVCAVRDGLLGFDEACARYNISAEEFAAWEKAIDRHGLGGLRVTRLREFR